MGDGVEVSLPNLGKSCLLAWMDNVEQLLIDSIRTKLLSEVKSINQSIYLTGLEKNLSLTLLERTLSAAFVKRLMEIGWVNCQSLPSEVTSRTQKPTSFSSLKPAR